MNETFSQQGQIFEYDILVIGSGLAGMHYCLQILKLQPQLKLNAVIAKLFYNLRPLTNDKLYSRGIA